jgi:hypothetical protein
MCEPFILEKTGFSIREHQQRSITSYLELRSRAPEVPWLPVLQGWNVPDYLHHVEMYERAGIALRTLPIVGIGSVCRRQGTRGAIDLLVELNRHGICLHGFGLKTTAVKALASFLTSSDSMAWSFNARRLQIRCDKGTCNNHLHYALEWRDTVLSARNTMPVQLGFPC